MKIELKKETRWDGVYYWTYVNGIFDHAYCTLEDAEKRYKELIENAHTPPVIEILKSEVII